MNLKESKKKLRPVPPCRFCQITKYEEPILAYREELIKKPLIMIGPQWWLPTVIRPLPRLKLEERKSGPYRVMNGKGFHELVITADHNQDIGQMETKRVKELIDVAKPLPNSLPTAWCFLCGDFSQSGEKPSGLLLPTIIPRLWRSLFLMRAWFVI